VVILKVTVFIYVRTTFILKAFVTKFLPCVTGGIFNVLSFCLLGMVELFTESLSVFYQLAIIGH